MTDFMFQEKFSSLLAALKAQVIDFIDFLLQKTQRSPEHIPNVVSKEHQDLQGKESNKPLIENPVPFRMENTHFEESKKALKDYKGSLSDAVIEERRAAL